MTDHILAAAKAYTALIGAVITAILGTVPPDTTLWQVLTITVAVCTAIATYAVPNTTPNTGPAGKRRS